jgi:hypothetical protein
MVGFSSGADRPGEMVAPARGQVKHASEFRIRPVCWGWRAGTNHLASLAGEHEFRAGFDERVRLVFEVNGDRAEGFRPAPF